MRYALGVTRRFESMFNLPERTRGAVAAADYEAAARCAQQAQFYRPHALHIPALQVGAGWLAGLL